MGILDKLLGRNKRTQVVTKSREEIQAECPHTTLLARWDSVDDMGKNEKATSFVCDSCHAEFSPDETEAIRAGHSERLRQQFEQEAEDAAEAERAEQAEKDAEESAPPA
jgi:hypothetical protein